MGWPARYCRAINRALYDELMIADVIAAKMRGEGRQIKLVERVKK